MASIASIPRTNFHARSISLPSRLNQISEFDDFEATTSSSSTSQVNEMLDELLRLLELCSTAKEALLMTRDSAQQLQSVLRRKRGDTIEVSSAIQEYQSQRKAVKKVIQKALRHLNGTSIKKKQETPLREVESVTLKVVESFLSFILESNSQKKSKNKWSMISKMMAPKHIACDESLEKELAQLEMSLEDHQEGLESIYRNLIKARVSLLNTLNC